MKNSLKTLVALILFQSVQAPVVQSADNSIYQISHYPVDSELCFVNFHLSAG